MTTGQIAEIGKHTEFIPLKEASRKRDLAGFDPELARLLRIPANTPSESVTYIYDAVHPFRVQVVGTDGSKFGRFGDLSETVLSTWTKVRATDQTTGQVVCYWTLETFTWSDGWKLYDPTLRFHLSMINDVLAPLNDFTLSSHDVNIQCGDNGVRRYATSSFSPDIYDADAGAWLYIPGGTLFQHC